MKAGLYVQLFFFQIADKKTKNPSNITLNY